ncbi:MAG: prepilin-type N-terminal cleavage/methylation domain-containing protein [Gemmatimonadaceae bacterium]
MNLILRSRTRSRRRTRQTLPRRRSGLSILEIMVALTLFGTVTVAMSGLSLVVAKRAEANDVFTKRTALLQQQMNWLQALPYDSLEEKAGTVLVQDGPFPHKRKISISSTGSRTRVTIHIIPTRAPERWESIQFDRARPTSSPLCREC